MPRLWPVRRVPGVVAHENEIFLSCPGRCITNGVLALKHMLASTPGIPHDAKALTLICMGHQRGSLFARDPIHLPLQLAAQPVGRPRGCRHPIKAVQSCNDHRAACPKGQEDNVNFLEVMGRQSPMEPTTDFCEATSGRFSCGSSAVACMGMARTMAEHWRHRADEGRIIFVSSDPRGPRSPK